MADDRYFLPDDESVAGSNRTDSNRADAERHAPDTVASPEEWAAMRFEALPIDVAKFGLRWEQARGTLARTAVELLRFDDQALTQHFLSQPEPLRHALDVHAGLQCEIDYLKTHIEALEMASTRLLCVASRCAEQ
jgi:hypothetical protein